MGWSNFFFLLSVFYPPSTQQPQLKPAVVPAPQRERKTLAIVDPNTGKNILDDMNNEKSDKTPTPPQSSESSTSNTPAPVSCQFSYSIFFIWYSSCKNLNFTIHLVIGWTSYGIYIEINYHML